MALPLSVRTSQSQDRHPATSPRSESRRGSLTLAPPVPTSVPVRSSGEDSLSWLRGGISRLRLLDAVTQDRLVREYAAEHSPVVLRTLVEANLRLVLRIVNRHRRAKLSVTDLVQEGTLGLIHALGKFDPERGVRLSTYAAWWIRAYVLRYIMEQSRGVRLARTTAQRKLFFGLERERQKLLGRGEEASPETLARILKVEPSDIVEMSQRLASVEVSIDAPSPHDEGTSTGERIRSETAGADELLEDADLKARMRDAIVPFRTGLDARERAVLDERILREPPEERQVLAVRFHVSRERIRQVELRVNNALVAHLRTVLGVNDATRMAV